MSQELIDAIVEMREDAARRIAQEMLDAGLDPLAVLDDSRQAMEVVGQRFESGNCFIPELILAGEMLSEISELIKPYLEPEVSQQKLGKVVIGTVEGDIHDIGKDIVAFMLDVNGFEVTDLGVDVPAARFVQTAQDSGAKIVALSGCLTLAHESMKATVEALKDAGLDGVRVMIGGGQVDSQVRDYTDADAFGKDEMTAVNLAKAWIRP
jgi:5-methyltetrahydrofolate--homocysteine methyltransferase